jgi:hypothetical protein
MLAAAPAPLLAQDVTSADIGLFIPLQTAPRVRRRREVRGVTYACQLGMFSLSKYKKCPPEAQLV